MIKKLVCIYTCEADKDDMLFIKNTDWYHDTIRSSDSKIIKVLASPYVSTSKLEGDTLWVHAPESYSTLSLKTYAMISACVELLDFQYLIKVDSSLTRYKPRSYRQALTFENFIKNFYKEDFYQEYNGLFKIESSSADLGKWAKLRGLDNFDLDKLSDKNVPDWFCGKCYVIEREVAEFISSNGGKCAEDHANFLGGSEDLMVGKMYSIYKDDDLFGNSVNLESSEEVISYANKNLDEEGIIYD